MRAKNQRLVLAGLAVAAIIVAALLALSALKDQAAFFYAPSDVRRDGLPLGRAVRLGGLVQPRSLTRAADGVTLRFVVTDGQAQVPATFRGIVPDLFREGSGVIAEGRFNPDGSFAADNILARHDENYRPPELANTSAGTMHETRTLSR